MQRQQNINELEVMDNIRKTFQVDKNEALKYFADWQSQIQMEVDRYENKKIKVLDNPGFEISIKKKDHFISAMEICNLIKIKNINNLNYLLYIENYVFLLISLITNDYDKDELNRICNIKKDDIIE